MCRRAAEVIGASADAPRRARGFLADQCEQWGLGEMVDDAVLLASELVTNAWLHTSSSPITLSVGVGNGYLEIGVSDADPRPPVLRPVRLALMDDVDALVRRATDGRQQAPGIDADERDPGWNIGPAGSIAAGRGLIILDAVADEWGVSQRSDGKEVWFRLETPEDWRPSQPCTCSRRDDVWNRGRRGREPSPAPDAEHTGRPPTHGAAHRRSHAVDRHGGHDVR